MVPSPETVLFEDPWFLAVDKPIGADAQKAVAGAVPVHRLDTPVSGVLLLAKTVEAAEAGRRLFADRAVEKVYWAVTGSALPFDQGELVHWLGHAQQGNKSRAYPEAGPGRKQATLVYSRLASSDRYFLYEVVLGTGRTHQIRAQFAVMGAPVRGDLKYGYPRSNPGGGIHLLARRLAFRHPFTGEAVALTAGPPAGDKLWKALADLVG